MEKEKKFVLFFSLRIPDPFLFGDPRLLINLSRKWLSQLCLTLCDHMDCGPPGSSVHGILQARVLEWIAIPFSRWSFQPRDLTQVSCIAGRFFTVWATGKIHTATSSLLIRVKGNVSKFRDWYQAPHKQLAFWHNIGTSRVVPGHKMIDMNLEERQVSKQIQSHWHSLREYLHE